jgi:hypothetical protein
MGNNIDSLNCCRGDNKDNHQIYEDSRPRENGTHSTQHLFDEKVNAARSNNRFIIDDIEDNNKEKNTKVIDITPKQDDEQANLVQDPKKEVKKKEMDKIEEDLNESVHVINEINTNINTKAVLKSFERERIAQREKEFPEFTKEYAIQKGSLSRIELESLYPQDNIVYDHGTLIPNKSFYYGEKNKKGKRHGFGTLVLNDGSKFIGFWLDNEFSYYGRYIDTDLLVHEGQFKNGVLNGQGEEHSLISKYKGQFIEGKKEGYGTLETDSEIYEGNFENGNKNGKGRIHFTKTDNYYEGDFSQGKIEGRGKFKWANGDYYEGDFLNGILHGSGNYYWQNGDIYEGSYVNGKRSGKGKLQNASRKVYEGDFADNVPHGKGIIIKDGKISEVEFNNGAPLTKRKSTIKSEN